MLTRECAFHFRPCEKRRKPISHAVLPVSRKRIVESLKKFYFMLNGKCSQTEDVFFICRSRGSLSSLRAKCGKSPLLFSLFSLCVTGNFDKAVTSQHKMKLQDYLFNDVYIDRGIFIHYDANDVTFCMRDP